MAPESPEADRARVLAAFCSPGFKSFSSRAVAWVLALWLALRGYMAANWCLEMEKLALKHRTESFPPPPRHAKSDGMASTIATFELKSPRRCMRAEPCIPDVFWRI